MVTYNVELAFRQPHPYNGQFDIDDWYRECGGKLSEDSPDWYEAVDDPPPFYIHFVQAGSRVGYRWQTRYDGGDPCEVNWLDPEPDSESSDYEEYIKTLRQIEIRVTTYRGFHQPPTEEEYHRLVDG